MRKINDGKKYTLVLTASSVDRIDELFRHTGIPRNEVLRNVIDRFVARLDARITKGHPEVGDILGGLDEHTQ